MAESKVIFMLCGILGIPVSVLGWIANMDNWKGTILFVVSLIIIMMHGYFYFIWANQKTRMRELDIKEKELKITDHESEQD